MVTERRRRDHSAVGEALVTIQRTYTTAVVLLRVPLGLTASYAGTEVG